MMLGQGLEPDTLPPQAIDLIAQRVIDALRTDLEQIAAALHPAAPAEPPARQLTVEQVAERLGVARSTVYAHWREWGGYKLGSGPKAPIRFDTDALPASPRDPAHAASREGSPAMQRLGKRMSQRATRRAPRGKDLLKDAPRLPPAFSDAR